MEFYGHQLTICLSALVWVKDCPFSKTLKPQLPLDISEVNGLYDDLMAHWVSVRDAIGVEAANVYPFKIILSTAHTNCIRTCLGAVLNECDGNSLELELRVGDPTAVRALYSILSIL